ncbi:MAG TPA: hypothetical protein VN721_16340 [Flavipsychrobacter sp.]|nr:hypothetical protein [Flavipsychrobacter sp.]
MYHKQQENYQLLGEFLKAFSEMETRLILYCSVIKYLAYCQEGLDKFAPYTISQRLDYISVFIDEDLPELKNEWTKIRGRIKTVNEERRYLVHGIGRTSMYTDPITTFIPKKGTTITKEFKTVDIKKLINEIYEICTGDNGLEGEFQNIFCTRRYDLYNDQIDNSQKIIYQINGVPVTKFKG